MATFLQGGDAECRPISACTSDCMACKFYQVWLPTHRFGLESFTKQNTSLDASCMQDSESGAACQKKVAGPCC